MCIMVWATVFVMLSMRRICGIVLSTICSNFISTFFVPTVVLSVYMIIWVTLSLTYWTYKPPKRSSFLCYRSDHLMRCVYTTCDHTRTNRHTGTWKQKLISLLLRTETEPQACTHKHKTHTHTHSHTWPYSPSFVYQTATKPIPLSSSSYCEQE